MENYFAKLLGVVIHERGVFSNNNIDIIENGILIMLAADKGQAS